MSDKPKYFIIIELDDPFDVVDVKISADKKDISEIDLMSVFYQCIDCILSGWDASLYEKMFAVACLERSLSIFPDDGETTIES